MVLAPLKFRWAPVNHRTFGVIGPPVVIPLFPPSRSARQAALFDPRQAMNRSASPTDLSLNLRHMQLKLLHALSDREASRRYELQIIAAATVSQGKEVPVEDSNSNVGSGRGPEPATFLASISKGEVPLA